MDAQGIIAPRTFASNLRVKLLELGGSFGMAPDASDSDDGSDDDACFALDTFLCTSEGALINVQKVFLDAIQVILITNNLTHKYPAML